MMNGKKKPMMGAGMGMGAGYKSGGKVPGKMHKMPDGSMMPNSAMKGKGYANGGMVKPKGKGKA
jgi:hypothetical protein